MTCRNGALDTPRGVGGAIFGDGTSLVPNKARIGVLVYSSHPLLTQASAQLYSFSGFRLTLSIPPPLSLFNGPAAAGEASGGLRGPPRASGASGSLGGFQVEFFWPVFF